METIRLTTAQAIVHWLVLTVRGASPSLPAPPWGKRLPSQHFVPHVFFDLDPMMVSTVVLCVTYGVIIWDKLNRAIVALLGAAFMRSARVLRPRSARNESNGP